LRELRVAADLTQQQLADRAGLSWKGVAQWERGVREPGWSNVLALAKALGVTCEAFTQAPAERAPARPGRPAKGKAPASGEKRGRPRKKE
jgi:transcriptional regulator with XRE-family HTH domain